MAAAATARAPWARPSAGAASPQVVIVGGGFAGGCCALEIRRLSPTLGVTLVDANAAYVTCPMSDAVITGLRTMSSITSTRAGIERAGVRLVHDTVARIDAGKRRVHLRGGAVIAYDKLILAPGIRFLFGQPEGYDEPAVQLMPHAWQAGSQTRLLATQLRTLRDGETLAISVPPGLMRCPPGPYERASLMACWLQQHRPRCKILIFDSNNQFPRQDVFTDIWRVRYPGLIEWIAPGEGGAITRVDPATRTLFSSSGAHRVALANVIPRQAPGQLATDTGLASGHGWCPIKPETFESQLVEGIHVIGDACIAGTMPKAASAARSQALHCARAIAAHFTGHPPASVDLDSVCYSMIATQDALVMRARFELNGGEIVQVRSDAPSREAMLEPVSAAENWYAGIRAQCFGDEAAGTRRSANSRS